MKNLLLLVIIGFAGYGAYKVWDERSQDVSRDSTQTAPNTQWPVAEIGSAKAPANSLVAEANAVITDIVEFTHQNLEQILSPIHAQGSQPTFGPLTQLKVRLLSQTRKPQSPQSAARIQIALRLVGTLEQVITQRAEHGRLLHAQEFAEGIEGTSSASKKNFQLSNEEERRRLGRT